MTGWFDDLSKQVRALLDGVWEEARQGGVLTMLEPIAPFNQSQMLAPVVGIAGLVSLMLLSGVALAAFGTLLVTMLGVYAVLARVFGISIEINPMAFMAR